jgi:acylglycerol lipase
MLAMGTMDTGTRHNPPPSSPGLLRHPLSGSAHPHVRSRDGARPRAIGGAFVMADGAVLPYREWLPEGSPETVVLALHGINDSADAWEAPSPHFVEAGIAVIAPDQRGFGAASGRGRWHGTNAMVTDAMTMVAETRARFPATRLYLAGESMGAAILMVLAARYKQLPVEGYVLSAPAIWGRREMAVAYRLSLWWAHKTIPWLRLSADRLGIKPTDNQAVLQRMRHPDLRRPSASVNSLKGLTDLMDAALATAGERRAPTLFLYGGKDQLVPKRAMAACWSKERAASLGDQVFAFYPDGYHLLHRDIAGGIVTRDVVNWLLDPAAPLPSGADNRAVHWLDELAA